MSQTGAKAEACRSGQLLLAVLATALGCSQPVETPRAEAGVLDLASWDFEADGNVTLQGQWSVCWNRLLPPDAAECPGGWAEVPVRGVWSEEHTGSPFGGKGVATYRLRLRLAPATPPLLLRAGSPYTAYRLWINGAARGGAGTVGPTAETSASQFLNRVFDLPSDAEHVDLQVQLANFEFRGGGLRRLWLVGRPDRIQAWIGAGVLRDALLAGIMAVVGLAYLVQFWVRRSEYARGYFGLFALVIGVRAIPGATSDFSQLLAPWASYELLMRSEYVLTALAIYAGAAYARTKVPGVMPPRTTRLVELTCLALAAIDLLAPMPILLATLPLVLVLPPLVIVTVVVGYGLAWRRGVPGVGSMVVAAIAYALVVLHDVTRTQTGAGLPLELFPYFVVIWLLQQATEMLQSFTRSYADAEALSDQLLDSNFELQETEAAVVRFVPFDVLRLLGRTSIQEIAPGDRVQRRMSVLYGRVRVLRGGVADRSSEDAFRVIHTRMGPIERVVQHAGGFLSHEGADTFIGLFPGGADDAVSAAIGLRDAIREAESEEPGPAGFTSRLDMGVATGNVIVGTIGSDQSLAGGVLGEAVEVARALEERCRAYDADFVLDGATRDALDRRSEVGWREVEVAAVVEGGPPIPIVTPAA